MVRLVKGAYWDAEIKRAQVEGIDGFPVFTAKALTPISATSPMRATLLEGLTDRLYPQFATHNAHTVAAVLDMAAPNGQNSPTNTNSSACTGWASRCIRPGAEIRRHCHCRIYAPVGAHEDLLAYLVRRLLENGANSSFVNQIVDADVPPEVVATCPFDAVGAAPKLTKSPDLFAPARRNAQGWDLTHAPTLQSIEQGRAPFTTATTDGQYTRPPREAP